MQLTQLSLTQVLVASLLVTSAAGAPLPLSGDLAARDDVSGLEARDVDEFQMLETRDPKIGKFFKKAGKALKPLGESVIQTVLPGVEIARRSPEPEPKIGKFFKKAGKALKPLGESVIQTVLPGVEIAKRSPEPEPKIGKFFKNVGQKLKKEGESMKLSGQIALGALGINTRDVDESAALVEARDVDEFQMLETRDPKIGKFFKKAGKALKPLGESVIQTVLPGVEIAKRSPEPEPKIGKFFKNVGQKLKKEGEILKMSGQMALGAVGITARDVDESAAPVEARDFDEHWE
ncbi:hypothetical protein RB601_005333 [Gaeumannomyces tritici]